jgi:hypothetical protein
MLGRRLAGVGWTLPTFVDSQLSYFGKDTTYRLGTANHICIVPQHWVASNSMGGICNQSNEHGHRTYLLLIYVLIMVTKLMQAK